MPHPVHILHIGLCFLQYSHLLIKEKLHLQSLTVASVQIVTNYPNQKEKQQIISNKYITSHAGVFAQHFSYFLLNLDVLEVNECLIQTVKIQNWPFSSLRGNVLKGSVYY